MRPTRCGPEHRASRGTFNEAVPRTDASRRSVAATRSPTNLRSVPIEENLTHLDRKS